MNPEITIKGRLGADPEKVGQTGLKLRVVTNDRTKNQNGDWEDKDTSWWTVKLWNGLAESSKNILKKGQEVIISGTIYQENWTDSNGNQRSSYEVRADNIAVGVRTLNKTTVSAVSTNTEDPWVKS